MLKSLVSKLTVFSALFGVLSSCGKKSEQFLIVKLVPKDTLVLEVPAAYSCLQIVSGISSSTGGVVTPEVAGPLIQFNRMTMEWTKENVPLHVHSAKLVIRGSGIAGGETTCDLTLQVAPLFESSAANNSAYFKGGEFLAKGKITSNPNCRIPCTVPLDDPDKPEIMATGELTVKASEVANLDTDEEVWHRVKSTFRFIIKP